MWAIAVLSARGAHTYTTCYWIHLPPLDPDKHHEEIQAPWNYVFLCFSHSMQVSCKLNRLDSRQTVVALELCISTRSYSQQVSSGEKSSHALLEEHYRKSSFSFSSLRNDAVEKEGKLPCNLSTSNQVLILWFQLLKSIHASRASRLPYTLFQVFFWKLW